MLYIQCFIHDAKLNFCCIFNIAKNVLGEKKTACIRSLSHKQIMQVVCVIAL